MIGCVKPRAFEYNPHWHIDLLYRFLAALRAADERRVGKLLALFELHTTVVTAVRISGHTYFFLLTFYFYLLELTGGIIAHSSQGDKGRQPIARQLLANNRTYVL